MVDTIIDPKLEELNEKEDKALNLLKKLDPRKSTRIKESIQKLTQIHVEKKEQAKQAVKNGVVTVGKNVLAGIMKTPAFILTLYMLVTQGPATIPFLFAAVSLLVGYFSFLDPVASTRIAFLISVGVILMILAYTFPWGNIDIENGFVKFIWGTIFIIITFLALFSFIGGGEASAGEVGGQIISDTTNSTKSLLAEFMCNINTQCLLERQAKANAQTVSSAKYEIKFNTPYTSKQTLANIQKMNIPMRYSVTSSGDMKLIGIKCYKDKVLPKNLFDEKTFEQNFPNTIGASLPSKEITCDMSGLTHTNTKEEDEVSIIPVLEVEVITGITIKIPVVSQEEYYEETKKQTSENLYLDKELKDYLASSPVKHEIIRTNDAIDIQSQSLEENMPLIYGNGDEATIYLEIIISANSDNSFGKLTKIDPIDEPNFPQIFQKKQESESYEEYSSKKGVFFTNYILTEDESVSDQLSLPLTLHDIQFNVKSTLEKEDKFKLIIIDPNWAEKQKAEEAKTSSPSTQDSDSQTQNPQTTTNSSTTPQTTTPNPETNPTPTSNELSYENLKETFDNLFVQYLNVDSNSSIEDKLKQINIALEELKDNNEDHDISFYQTIKNDLDEVKIMIENQK